MLDHTYRDTRRQRITPLYSGSCLLEFFHYFKHPRATNIPGKMPPFHKKQDHCHDGGGNRHRIVRPTTLNAYPQQQHSRHKSKRRFHWRNQKTIHCLLTNSTSKAHIVEPDAHKKTTDISKPIQPFRTLGISDLKMDKQHSISINEHCYITLVLYQLEIRTGLQSPPNVITLR
ncbi:conserved hypothetical protein [Xylella fastidiosa Temecula1]|uniref:Uncharacterized protein n=1 Tax=Xylella fastidiosa (strain Temecula1 / ATCC 700964) TaxID=183190 RepID=Q87F15_XYLFT|nr:conserved hypothetical protein [Xylella fastidiosa Temecula1]